MRPGALLAGSGQPAKRLGFAVGLSGALLGGIIAGCGVSGHAAPPAHHPPAVAATTRPANPGSPGSPAPSGPFKIKALYCGKFNQAQQDQFTDYSGLIFRYTNVSNSIVGSPALEVNFTKGSAVLGRNVSLSLSSLSPGQSAIGDVGAGTGLGPAIKGYTACQMVSYAVVTDDGGQSGTFTP